MKLFRFTKDDDLLKHSFRISDNQTSGNMKQRLDITELDAGKTCCFVFSGSLYE